MKDTKVLIIKSLIKLCLSILLVCTQSLAFGQAINPKYSKVQTHTMDMNGGVDYGQCSYEKVKYLPEKKYFPWGVCRSWTIPAWDDHLSDIEWAWVQDAMHQWNSAFTNYKLKKWGTLDVEGLPDRELFVNSCDRHEHNIVYIKIGDTNFFTQNDSIASYRPRFFLQKLLFSKFYGVILFTNFDPIEREPMVWGKYHFINVMMHELGHALGLAHSMPDDTEVMASEGFKECEGKKEVCDIKPHDLDKFVSLYNKKLLSMSAQEYNNYITEKLIAKKRKEKEDARKYMDWVNRGCPMYSHDGRLLNRMNRCP